jgi:hypothetical protein
MTDTIETKIAKLLAKAEATTNQHEAEAFMEHAERLMLKHGVERAQLEAKQVGATRKTTPIVTKRIRIKDGSGYALAFLAIGHEVGPVFNVRTLQSTISGSPDKMIWFIGHEDDVADVETLFTSLMKQAQPAAVAWWRNDGKANWNGWYAPTDNDAYLARREFIFGFARGAGARLRETRGRVVQQAGSGAELVLVDRSKAVDRWIEDNLQVGKGRATNRRVGGAGASSAGREAGRNAVASRALGR